MKKVICDSDDPKAKKYNVGLEWFTVTCECGHQSGLWPNHLDICSKCGRGYKPEIIVKEYEPKKKR